MKRPNLTILVVFSYLLFGFACSKGEISTGHNREVGAVEATPKSTRESLDENEKKWDELNLRDYDFELSAEGYLRAFAPLVKVSVRDGKVESIKTSDGKSVTYPRMYEEFSTVEKIFKFLNEVDSRRPDRIQIACDEQTGYPTYVDLDEKEGMSDDELTLRIKNLQIHN